MARREARPGSRSSFPRRSRRSRQPFPGHRTPDGRCRRAAPARRCSVAGTREIDMRHVHAPGPHDRQPLLEAGRPLAGRAYRPRAGARARRQRRRHHGALDGAAGEGMAYLAPQAAGHTWYPNRFLAPHPVERAVALVGARRARRRGARRRRRRACPPIASSSSGSRRAPASRSSTRCGIRGATAGIVALSGGLIGPPGTTWQPRRLVRRHAGVPRVQRRGRPHPGRARPRVGGRVQRRPVRRSRPSSIPGMDHTVSDEELVQVRALLDRLPG